jgi:amino acid adenylation domain-containing protein
MEMHPLLQSQMSVFVGWQMRPTTTAWNLPSVISFPKTVGLKRVQAAAERITQHQATHTRFVHIGTTIRQYTDPSMTIPIATRQMTEAEAEEYMENDFVRPFEPFGGAPLCRIEIIETPQRLLLLTDFHHTIADGTSIVRMMNEEEEGQMEMAEAAEAEVATFETEAYREAKKWTLEHFQGTELTVFATPRSGQTPWGRHLIASFTTDKRSIDEWCTAHRTKVSILFTAAFSIVLAKLTRQERVAFFTLSHGRTDARLRHTFGMFVRSLPLWVDADGELPVMDFIQRVQHEQLSALKNHIYPATHFCRDRQMGPAVTFGFQGTKIEEVCMMDGIPYKGVQLPHREACNDLNCTIYSDADNYEVRTDASEALVGLATLNMVAKAVVTCIQSIITHSSVRLKDISIADDNEQRHLISLGKGELLEYDDTQTWLDLFEEQVQKTPHAKAVVAGNGSLTYQELDRRSSAYAEEVAKKQQADSPFVCLKTTRQKEWMVKVIGVMKAGLAYVPIDPEWPEARQAEIRNDINRHPSTFKLPPSSFAYMIYTSGSTGKPKGVMVTHRGLFNLTHFIVNHWHLTAESRISCHSPLSFDASVEDLFPVLSVGGTLYIIPDDIRMNLSALARYLKDNGITGGCYTTQMGVMLAEKHQLEVDYLCVGGEKLTRVPPITARLINTYGPTECTVDATYCEIAKDKTYDDIPIGRPLDNMQVFVTDPQGQLLPQGATGELWIAGPQVAAGYWNDEALTKEKFTDCTFCTGKVYHTGDLVKWNEGGLLEFVGRTDRQIKRNGFRIEPEEIASALLQLKGIRQAVVTQLSSTDRGEELLCAYFTADKDMKVDDIRRELSMKLPDYLMPDTFMQLAKIPLTANGKTDYKRLPNPQPVVRQRMKPANEREELLCRLFAKVLQMDEVGATDNFFDLGGTSLSAIQLIGELENVGIKRSYQDIFERATPRELGSLSVRAPKEIPLSDHKEIPLSHSPQGERVNSYTIENSSTLKHRPVGNVTTLSPWGELERGILFLTGATGFLGSHVLRQLLAQGTEKVFCLVRDKDDIPAEERLKGKGISIVKGDITAPYSQWSALPCHSSEHLQTPIVSYESSAVVIHCAADVRHFARGTELEDTNVKGTEHIIDFCLQHHIRLIHISTASLDPQQATLPTLSPKGELGKGHFPYLHSKQLAEERVSNAAATKGLQAQILRVGNLIAGTTEDIIPTLSSLSDLSTSNAFLGFLRLMQQTGVCPESLAELTIDLSPVDLVAKEILLRANDEAAFTCQDGNLQPITLHVAPPVTVAQLVQRMNRQGIPVTIARDHDVINILQNLQHPSYEAYLLKEYLRNTPNSL